jgi:bifunctional DNA-binding transcriptional regulator/antitoxin component of YhaV-PrlF toxin-antitoxin module
MEVLFLEVKLQYRNGSYYILIPKSFRQLLELKDKAEMDLKNNEIIIKPIKKVKEEVS